MNAGSLSDGLVQAAIDGDASAVKRCLLAGAKDVFGDALVGAARHGHLAAVQVFLATDLPPFHAELALVEAAQHGRTPVVAALIAAKQPNSSVARALQSAVESGHLEATRLLLQVCEADFLDGTLLMKAMTKAISVGRRDLFEVLLPATDLGRAHRFNEALECAAKQDNPEMAARLLENATPDALDRAFLGSVQDAALGANIRARDLLAGVARWDALDEAVKSGFDLPALARARWEAGTHESTLPTGRRTSTPRL